MSSLGERTAVRGVKSNDKFGSTGVSYTSTLPIEWHGGLSQSKLDTRAEDGQEPSDRSIAHLEHAIGRGLLCILLGSDEPGFIVVETQCIGENLDLTGGSRTAGNF